MRSREIVVAARQLRSRMRGGEKFEAYRDDPVGFFRDVLKLEPWEAPAGCHGQIDVIRAVGECDRVAVKSGHKVSKTNTAVGLALWFVATRESARVVLTAPAFHQVKNVLWHELSVRDRDSRVVSKLNADLAIDPATGLRLPNGNHIFGISAGKAENLAGLSGEEQMFIIDEASGYPDKLYTTLMGNAAGGVKIFAISNPTRTTGWFFELFKRRATQWRLFTISSETTPNVVSGKVVIKGIARSEWIQEMRENCGPDYLSSATYMVRVQGMFPAQGSDCVISLGDLERAVARWSPKLKPDVATLVLGVDVSRYGSDANVIQPVRGNYAYPARVYPPNRDGNQMANEICIVARELRRNQHERVIVRVDGVGVGAATVDALKLTDDVLNGAMSVVDTNVGEKADDESRYTNLRSQVWFAAAEWLKGGGCLPPDDNRDTELLAPVYTFDSRGRMKVEEKKSIRATIGRSPDYADALCLAVYSGGKGRWTGGGYETASDHRKETLAGSHRDYDDDDDGDDFGGGGIYLAA